MKEFNSQICTTREQSERLLALGLKKETADMCWIPEVDFDAEGEPYDTGKYFERPIEGVWDYMLLEGIPAWSLHRLIEMLNIQIQTDGRYIYLADGGFDAHASIYDNIIDCIEWLINGGYFNKEYLVNQAEVDEHCKGVLEYLDYIRDEKGKQ